MTQKQTRRVLILFSIDLVVLGVSLCIFALFHHVLPHSIGNLYGSTRSGELLDFSEKFPDVFAQEGQVIREDGVYRDENVSLTVTTHAENGVTYYVADFYVRHITSLRTAMASEEFATGVSDSVLNIAKKSDALVAVSGDYFGIRQRGIVIRNGQIYRKTKAHQICVLYYDGTMETYSFEEFDVERAIAGGAWQAWDFGPALLDRNGKAVTSFHPGIAGENPRVAIGYYEPGHYCFITVDGRQAHSRGMTLKEMAALFEKLGCKRAYNLDGGHSAAMVVEGELFSSPSKENGRNISDIVYLTATPPRKEEE
ncbi:MAG: phosphodiester glycosidase family protein [Ruminococcaceae bacterium]|nr:phosphodiester glycosidase family protein [Oscillospiraceae bacterium]